MFSFASLACIVANHAIYFSEGGVALSVRGFDGVVTPQAVSLYRVSTCECLVMPGLHRFRHLILIALSISIIYS